jgi:thioredoxin-like negative regulator of GroEL
MADNDYFMRQIRNAVDVFSSLMGGQTSGEGEHEIVQATNSEDTYMLMLALKSLVVQRRMNEAEDLLFEHMETNPTIDFQSTAMQFYDWLDALEEEELLAHNFTHAEIGEGRAAVKKFYAN